MRTLQCTQENVQRLIRYPRKEDSNESLRGTYTEFYSWIGGCPCKDRDKFYCSFLFSSFCARFSTNISLNFPKDVLLQNKIVL